MADMTPAENAAEAQDILGRLHQGGIGTGTQLYQNLLQRAIGHGLLAATGVLTEMLALMSEGQHPSVPGLPRGYEIVTEQAPENQHKWRYVLAGPQFSYSSRYRWDISETALGAGIQHAQQREQQRAGLNGDGGQDEPERCDIHGGRSLAACDHGQNTSETEH